MLTLLFFFSIVQKSFFKPSFKGELHGPRPEYAFQGGDNDDCKIISGYIIAFPIYFASKL